MGADGDLDVDPEIVGAAQHFDDAAHGALTVGFVLQKFGVDDHAVEVGGVLDVVALTADAVGRGGQGRDGHVLGNLDPVLDALVVRDDEEALAGDAEFADYRRVSPAQNPDDLAVGLAVALDAEDVDDGAVAVHGAGRLTFGQEDVAAETFNGAVGNQEAVAVAVQADAAGGVLA